MDSEGFRRARDYVAWILLAAAAVEVVLGAWTLSGLPGGPYSGVIFGPASEPAFSLRAGAAMPYLIAVDVTVLPVAAVLLVALVGGRSASARPIMLTAVTVQTVALALGLLAWVATIGHSGRWLAISSAADLAVAAAGLILTAAVRQSRTSH